MLFLCDFMPIMVHKFNQLSFVLFCVTMHLPLNCIPEDFIGISVSDQFVSRSLFNHLMMITFNNCGPQKSTADAYVQSCSFTVY